MYMGRDVSQIGIILIGLGLSFVAGAESEWLVPQPETLQIPASVNTPQQDCNYQQQITLARKGIAENQYQVALCYYYGLDVDADPKKARYWLTQAAKQKHTEAIYELAEFYNRRGRYHDPAQAVEWYRRAACVSQ